MLENMKSGTRWCVVFDLTQIERFVKYLLQTVSLLWNMLWNMCILYRLPSFHSVNLVSFLEKLQCCWSILHILLSLLSLNSESVLKSPMTSRWNPWAVSSLSRKWVRKDACNFVMTGCIDTPSKFYWRDATPFFHNKFHNMVGGGVLPVFS